MDDKPKVLVAVHGNNFSFGYLMIIDSGADSTCFPADFAEFIGHDNQHPDVETVEYTGIGGKAKGYRHTLNLSLLDPTAPLQKSLIHLPTIWTPKVNQFVFVEKFKCNHGLIGRDVIREWKRLTLIPSRGKWSIEIEINDREVLKTRNP